MGESFENKSEECPFCDFSKDRTVAQNELAFVIRDGYPVTPLHTLVIPKRHFTAISILSPGGMETWKTLVAGGGTSFPGKAITDDSSVRYTVKNSKATGDGVRR